MMRRKPYAFGFLSCSILIVLLFVGCAKGKADPVGIYLAMRGQAYVEIARDASDNLMIKETSLLTYGRAKWEVSLKKQKLVLFWETKWRMRDNEPGNRYELVPSITKPRDWDLVRFIPIFLARNLKQAEQEVPSLKQPIRSFLHRLDDRRVVEYFNRANKYHGLMPEPDVSRLFELASGLLASYPDDLYVRSLYLDALVRKRDSERLESQLTVWREAYATTDNLFLRSVIQDAANELRAMQLSAAGRNAYDFVVKVLTDIDLATRFELFPNILEYEEYAPARYSLAYRGGERFLVYQVAAKIFRVGSVFMMLQGKREDALKILTANYHFGQLLNHSDRVIARMVGSAIRWIACGGLQLYALNCCETADDFQHLWKILEELNHRSREADVEALSALLDPMSLYLPEMALLDIKNIEKAVAWHLRADARFQLLRMATAAKYRLFTQQAFPSSADEFAPLLPQGPPEDPFGLEPLKFLSAPESFTCYSIGPDEQDNRAIVSYDPTNGTVSGGDIIVEIPQQREYPFPRDGVKAASADELRRQFPNGLPRDPFADTRGPLGISNTIPVYVYSYGPDVDQSEARKVGDRYVPEVLYDPTNGTISPGDLFIAIPR